jgi:hypothetical protein
MTEQEIEGLRKQNAFDRIKRLLIDTGMFSEPTSPDTVADFVESLVCNNITVNRYAFDVHERIDVMFRGFYYSLGASFILEKPMNVGKFNEALAKSGAGWRLVDLVYPATPDTLPVFVKVDTDADAV